MNEYEVDENGHIKPLIELRIKKEPWTQNFTPPTETLEKTDMAASQGTIVEIYGVLTQYLGRQAITDILDDLSKIEGNESYRDTIAGLKTLHEYLGD